MCQNDLLRTPYLKLLIACFSIILCAVPGEVFAQKKTIKDSWPQRSAKFYQGFVRPLEGERLDFLQNLQDQSVALLVRADDGKSPIVFQTEAYPEVGSRDKVTFLWEMALATNRGEVHHFNLKVNNEDLFQFTSNKDTLDPDWVMKGKNGFELAFVHSFIDKKQGDLFGFMFLTMDGGMYPAGQPLTISIAGQAEGSQDWYMAFQNMVGPRQEMQILPALKSEGEVLKQPLEVSFMHLDKPKKARITVDDKVLWEKLVRAGENKATILLDKTEKEEMRDVAISVDGKLAERRMIEQKPVRHFEIYFLPHSHVDIGFTHRQDEVEQMQWRNFEQAIALSEKTKDYPEGSQYKWNVEVMWAVDGYLKQASPEKKQALIDAVRKGWIGLDALYGSELTGLQREEEMMNNTLYARRFAEEYDYPIETAMITDVPGYTWGMVPSLAESGVKYLSVGPNHMPHLAHGGYQVGFTFEAWGDVPFYWLSPSGNQKILFWMSTHGYSWFHDWLLGTLSKSGSSPILKFLDELDADGYPYDIVQLRYTMGDNAGPDQNMPDWIREWNRNYTWPKMRIATTPEMFADFEEKYGDALPEFSGDFSPYWEDGAASSAHETAMNRNAADKLVRAEALWSMVDPANFPRDLFDEAWTNVVLFSEHTWGSITSKSDPEGDLAQDQWKVKAGFAEKADSLAELLTERAIGKLVTGSSVYAADTLRVSVLNSLSWPRTDIATLDPHQVPEGFILWDDKGKNVPVQHISTGKWVFLAEDIPPMSSREYTLTKGIQKQFEQLEASPVRLSNELLEVSIDTAKGRISSISRRGSGHNFVDAQDDYGFNGYWYSGLNAANPETDSLYRFSITDQGPVLTSLTIFSAAPGARGFRQDISLVNGMDEVYITNTVDKVKQLEDENLRFSFPFDIEGGEWRFDIPYAILQPGKNQLNGANKNFFCPGRWMDISNSEMGVTLVNLDAPLAEVGQMWGQDWMKDMVNRPWLKELPASERLFSWVMNNAWFVNYKGYQEGRISYRYVIRPHDSFDNAAAKRLGMEKSMPLMAIVADAEAAAIEAPVRIVDSDKLILQSIRPLSQGSGYLVKIHNPTEETIEFNLDFTDEGTLYISNANEISGKKADEKLKIDGWDLMIIRFERKE